MAFAGSSTLIRGGNALFLYVDGFDADNEEVVVDCVGAGIGGFHSATIIVQRTAGSTALIDVTVQGSNDGTTYVDVVTVTAKDTHGADDAPAKTYYRYAKVISKTVGSGNTLDAYVTLSEGDGD